MKKVIILLLTVTLLFISACRGAVTPSDDTAIDENVLSTPIASVDNEGFVDFNTKILTNYANASYYDYKEVECEATAYTSQGIGKRLFFDGKLDRKRAIYLYDTHVDDATVKKCAEWLSALYDTQYYSSAEMMERNILKRTELLSDGFSRYLTENGIIRSIIADNLHNGIRQSVLNTSTPTDDGEAVHYCVNKYLEFFSANGTEPLRALTFETTLRLNAPDISALIPASVLRNDYFIFNLHYVDDTTAEAWIPLSLAVLLNEKNEIVGWCELFDKESSTSSTRYLMASGDRAEAGIMRGGAILVVDSSFRSVRPYVSGPQGQSAQKLAISCYKYLIGLDAKADENYFDGFIQNCSPELKAKLTDSGILNDMVADARHHNISFSLDPKSDANVSKLTSSVSVHENTRYGKVYVITKSAYLKTGSEIFNQQYGLPPERYNATFTFYVTCTDNSPRLAAFSIASSARDNPLTPEFVDIDAVWSGTWDNG